MRKSARAILISPENHLILMKRIKNGETYYVTIGGGLEPEETGEQAVIREIREESGSTIDVPRFVFRDIDTVWQTDASFYICHEISREIPNRSEWTKYNTPDNRYEVVVLSPAEAQSVNLKPTRLKERILSLYLSEIGNKNQAESK